MSMELDNRAKKIIILFGICLIGYGMYSLVIADTLMAYQENTQLRKELVRRDSLLLGFMNREGESLKGGKMEPAPDENVRESILRLVASSRDRDINLLLVEETGTETIGDYMLHTEILRLEGSFIGLTRFVYLIESQMHMARIISLKMETVMDRSSKTEKLVTEIIIQSIQ